MAARRKLVAFITTALIIALSIVTLAILTSVWIDGALVDVFATVAGLSEAAFALAVEASTYVDAA